MKNLVDLHTHILPGLDDGAGDLEDSLRMARLAVVSGVRCVAATPHSCGYDGFDSALAKTVLRRTGLLQKKLDEEGIPLVLVPGMEILADDGMAELLREGKLLPYAETNYVLVEFRFDEDPVRTFGFLEELTAAGYVPVVAHPERYPYVQRETDLAEDWVHQGCLLQMNQGSLTGSFGMEAALCARQLLSRGLVAAVASDAHSPQHRSTDLRPAVQWMKQMRVPAETAKLLLSENPLRILQGKVPVRVEPLLL